MTLSNNSQRPLWEPALAAGLTSAVAVWIAWFLTHVPWIGLTGPISLGIVLVAWLAAGVFALRGVGSARIWLVGLVGGGVTSILSLFLLGSKITHGKNEFTPNAAMIVLGFVALGLALGLASSLIAGRLTTRNSAIDWVSRFAWATVAAAAPLLFIGGLVTSTQSGMAVPDWPTTYSANMFLYPLGNAPVDIFLEHSHRLFGTLLGMGSLMLMILVLVSERRGWVKVWAVAIFVAICAQGALGGARVLMGSTEVVKDNRLLSLLHGVSAQAIFAALVALAVYLTPLYRNTVAEPALPRARALRAMATAALHTTLLQLVFGALYRHFGGNHSLWTHAGFSIVVVITTALSGFYAMALPSAPDPASTGLVRALRTVGKWQIAVVALQFALGWVAFAVAGNDRSAANTVDALIRTGHQANGALLLGVTTFAAVLARRLCPKRAKSA